MKMRIQPNEIEIPSDDPFRHDLLARKKPGEILTNLVDNLDGPCVLAVDAAWGAGKTTFVKMWAQYLQSKGFPVVEFNAWETDFSEDPFAALSSDLTKGLSKYTDNGIGGSDQRCERGRTATCYLDCTEYYSPWNRRVRGTFPNRM